MSASPRRIGFLTSTALPDLSSDDRCVLDALAAREIEVRELASFGAALPPTAWVEAGDRRPLATVLAEAGLDHAVVKPRISLSAADTFRVGRHDAAERESAYRAIVATRAVLVQAFVPAIVGGEISLVYLGGRFSHAIRKTPADGDFRVQSDYGGTRSRVDAKATWLAAADAVLARLPPLLYARIDLVEDGDALLWMELEAIDPELFFALVPESRPRFADALLAALRDLQ